MRESRFLFHIFSMVFYYPSHRFCRFSMQSSLHEGVERERGDVDIRMRLSNWMTQAQENENCQTSSRDTRVIRLFSVPLIHQIIEKVHPKKITLQSELESRVKSRPAFHISRVNTPLGRSEL